jgi:hypothetical protein
MGDGGGGYVGRGDGDDDMGRVDGDEDSGGRADGEEEIGGRDGRLGPAADSGECLRLEDAPEWRDGDPPDESVADLKGWIALMDGRRMGRGAGAGEAPRVSGSACSPDLGLPNLGLPLPLPGRGDSGRGGAVDTGLEVPPSMDTGRDPPLPLPPDPEWRERDPPALLLTRAGGGPRRRLGCGMLAGAGRTKRSARIGPGGERGWLARMGEPLSDVCCRAASVGVNDSSSCERKRDDSSDSSVSMWKSGERRYVVLIVSVPSGWATGGKAWLDVGSEDADEESGVPNLSMRSSFAGLATRTWMPRWLDSRRRSFLKSFHAGSTRRSVNMLRNTEMLCLYTLDSATSGRSSSYGRPGLKMTTHDSSRT